MTMTNWQLLVSVGLPIFAIVLAVLYGNSRLTTLETQINGRFSDLQGRFSSLEARFTALEGRIDHILELVLRHDAILRGK